VSAVGLSDTVGASGLSLYPQVALLIFLAVFVLVALRAALSLRGDCERAAALPLEDGTSAPGTAVTAKGGDSDVRR
jgi:hypothetical protein